MQNILITGATGYSGFNLAKYLSLENYNVFCLVRTTSDKKKIAALSQFSKCYFINDYNSIKSVFNENKIDTVIHLAALAKYHYQESEIEKIIEANFGFGIALLEAMQGNCSQIINFGTYWQNNENGDSICLYAALKQSFENILKFYSKTKNINFISLRLTDIYGENDDRPKIFNQLKKHPINSKMPMTDGYQEINLLYIKDVMSATKQALALIGDRIYNNNVYYVCGNETLTLREIVDIYKKETKNNVEIDWGAIPYNKNQIMKLNIDKTLPGFKAKYNFIDVAKNL